MDKFTSLTATACPLGLPNVDTDQLLPARFLKIPRSAGLGRFLLHDLRFDETGQERKDFPLNERRWRDARILIAGRNFGGGSSREAAVYAVFDAGIRCVIAPSFGDIFAQNATKNGLLTAIASQGDVEALTQLLHCNPTPPVTVNLLAQEISCRGETFAFGIDRTKRDRLLNAWDDIDLTKKYAASIKAFKYRDARDHEWKYI